MEIFLITFILLLVIIVIMSLGVMLMGKNILKKIQVVKVVKAGVQMIQRVA